MTDIELLPLPKKAALVNLYAGRGVPTYGHSDETLTGYARANVAHATAPLQAEIEALRAEVERLQEIVRPKRENECLTLDHWRIRAYYLEGNWSRCSHACAIEQTKREQAEARAERLAEALREARDAIEDWAGYASDYFREKHDLAGDLAKIDALLRDQEEGNGQ